MEWERFVVVIFGLAARRPASAKVPIVFRNGEPPRNPWCFSLTAEWKVLAVSFGQVTRFWHIKLWNAFSFNKYIFSFLSITLRSHQFVIKPWCVGSWSWQRKCACDFSPFVLEYLRDLRCRNEPALCLFTIPRFLKLLFRTLWVDFRCDGLVARINHSSRKNTPHTSHYYTTTPPHNHVKPT